MHFLHPSPYELGGSPDIEIEDAMLAASGIRPYTGTELGLIPLEGADPVSGEALERGVHGFSLTALPMERIDTRLGIEGAAERLYAGLDSTFYDRTAGSPQVGPDGAILS